MEWRISFSVADPDLLIQPCANTVLRCFEKYRERVYKFTLQLGQPCTVLLICENVLVLEIRGD